MRRAASILALLSHASASDAGQSRNIQNFGIQRGSDAEHRPQPGLDVVYGEDNRTEAYVADLLGARWQDATAADVALVAVSNYVFDESSNTWGISPDVELSYYTSVGGEPLCDDERFYAQLTPTDCSGFLIDAQTVVTAGHCLDEAGCQDKAFVFDMRISPNDEDPDVDAIPADNFYKCASRVAWALSGNRGYDFGLWRLDRPVTGRKPLTHRQASGIVEPDTELIVIGHPSGLPTKVTPGGEVKASDPKVVTFSASVDTYGGNSGSMVLNAETFEVEGILVAGRTDFVLDEERQCTRSNYCDENEGCSVDGEVVGFETITGFGIWETFLDGFEGLRLSSHNMQPLENVLGSEEVLNSYEFQIENTVVDYIDWEAEVVSFDGEDMSTGLTFPETGNVLPFSSTSFSVSIDDGTFPVDQEYWVLIKDTMHNRYREVGFEVATAWDVGYFGEDVDSEDGVPTVGVRVGTHPHWSRRTTNAASRFPCLQGEIVQQIPDAPLEIYAVSFNKDLTIDVVLSSADTDTEALDARIMSMYERGNSDESLGCVPYDVSLHRKEIKNVEVVANTIYIINVGFTTYHPTEVSVLSFIGATEDDIVHLVDEETMATLDSEIPNVNVINTAGSDRIDYSYYSIAQDNWLLDASTIVSGGTSGQVWAQFRRIDLSSDSYIVIRDGRNEFAPILATLEGFDESPWEQIFASTSGALFVQFVSLTEVNHADEFYTGFAMDYMLDDDSSEYCSSSEFLCPDATAGKCVDASALCNGINDGCTLARDEDVCAVESLCQSTSVYTDTQGSFTDGSAVTIAYEENLFTCFQVSPTLESGQMILLEFDMVDIYTSGRDGISVFTGADEFGDRVGTIASGEYGPEGFTVVSSEPLFLVFRTGDNDGEEEHFGFAARYSIVDEAPVCGGEEEYQCALGGCIPETFVCDEFADCIGGDDEINCECAPLGTELVDLSVEHTDDYCASFDAFSHRVSCSVECLPGYVPAVGEPGNLSLTCDRGEWTGARCVRGPDNSTSAPNTPGASGASDALHSFAKIAISIAVATSLLSLA